MPGIDSADPRPSSLLRQRDFWDHAARGDTLLAIYDSPEMRGADRPLDLFSSIGERDAAWLAWFAHPDATVVDLGCGIGRLLRPLAAHCKAMVGVDISAEMLARARSYLGEAPNVELRRTDGRTLPGVGDGSVDFLFSMLVLIHVDRRSAFAYFREVRRVLRPGGVAYLQLQNLLSPAGLRKFLAAVDTDYPLEFYTEVELRQMLRSAGLDVLWLEPEAEYFYVTVVVGDAGRWLDDVAAGIAIVDHEIDGVFAADTFDLSASGTVRCRVRAAPDQRRTLMLAASLSRRGEGPDQAGWFRFWGLAPVRPGGEVVLELRYDGSRPLGLRVDGSPVAFATTFREPDAGHGPATLHLGLMPPGCYWREPFLARFPSQFLSRHVDVVPAGGGAYGSP